ncbi:MAG: hypothetical protein PUI81_00845, partial [Veillonellaceae bacterium]|nr:hypothetical protein [Veillonellaceae bacterium]
RRHRSQSLNRIGLLLQRRENAACGSFFNLCVGTAGFSYCHKKEYINDSRITHRERMLEVAASATGELSYYG